MSGNSIDKFIQLVLRGEYDSTAIYLQDDDFDMDAKDENYRTAFLHAVETKNYEAQQFLIMAGSDVNEWMQTGDWDFLPSGWTTALEVALTNDDLKSIQTILEAPTFDPKRHTGIWVSIPSTTVLGYIDGEDEKVLFKRQKIHEVTLDYGNAPGPLFLTAIHQDLDNSFEKHVSRNFLSLAVARDVGLSQNHYSIIVAFGCKNFPKLNTLLSFTQPIFLTSVYAVSCGLTELDSWDGITNCRNLEVLVLSDNLIPEIPDHVFRLKKLRVLKVDRNHLTSIPYEVCHLESLVHFSCDFNKLVSIPKSIGKLKNLEILTCSNNSISNISWLYYCHYLKKFDCSNNDITVIPSGIDDVSLPKLKVLDISSNKIRSISPMMLDLIQQQLVFRYYSDTLNVQNKFKRSRKELTEKLNQERQRLAGNEMLLNKVASAVFLGSKNSGKTLLLKALNSPSGASRSTSKDSDLPFEIYQTTWEDKEKSDSYHVSSVILKADNLDDFARNIADGNLYVVPIAIHQLSSSSKNGQAITSQQLDSLGLWMNVISDVMKSTDKMQPVLIVGTHADLIRSKARLKDVWKRVKGFLMWARLSHVKKIDYHPYCLMCNAERGALTRKTHKDAGGMGGLAVNWNANYIDDEDLIVDDIKDVLYISGPEDCIIEVPHVVGYHEVSSMFSYPAASSPFKSIKGKHLENWSIDMVLRCLLRQLERCGSSEYIAQNWVEAGYYFQSLSTDHANTPVRRVQEIERLLINIFSIPKEDIKKILKYYHRRGVILFFSDIQVLNQAVILSPIWFFSKLKEMPLKLQRSGTKSMFDFTELQSELYDEDLNRVLEGEFNSDCSEWLLSAMLKFEICIKIPCQQPVSEQQFFFPGLLPKGVPDSRAWPETPSQGEKHITCEIKLIRVEPTFFQELIVLFLTKGQKEMKIVTKPSVFLLRSDLVFFTNMLPDECKICPGYQQKKHDRHRIRIQVIPFVDNLRVSVRGNNPCCIMTYIIPFIDKYLRCHVGSRGFERWKIVCPQCIVAREKTQYTFDLVQLLSQQNRRFLNPICENWHDLGSWQNVMCGHAAVFDTFKITKDLIQATGDLEIPKLFVILREDIQSGFQNWIMFSKIGFLDGYALHLLCECPNYWHFTDSPGYALQRPKENKKEFMQVASKVLTVAAVTSDLFLKISSGAVGGPIPQLAGLMSSGLVTGATGAASKTSDVAKGLASHLDTMLKDFSSQYKDLNFNPSGSKAEGGTIEEVFTQSHSLSRRELARFFKENDSDGRFGELSPRFIGNSVKWLCREHHKLFENVSV